MPRRPGAATRYRMSHFTARCVLAGLELYQQGAAPRFVLPGEQHGPSTSDLERAFLLRQGVPPERILALPDLDGTLQQLEPVARLQRQGRLGRVVVLAFAFHCRRVERYMRLLGLAGDVAEVERTHVEFLGGRARVTRADLVGLPQLEPIRRAERGISGLLLALDRPFGRWAPASRLYKLLTGPAVTDLDHGRPRLALARLEAARSRVAELRARARTGC